MDSAHDCWYTWSLLFLTGVSAGKEDIVDRLLEVPATDATIQNRNGATALYTIYPILSLILVTTPPVKIESMYYPLNCESFSQG